MLKYYYSSYACAINLGSSVILTGGRDTLTRVSQYNETGWEKDLPTLQTGRRNHGCAYFNNNAGSKVGSINFFFCLPLKFVRHRNRQ